MKSQILNQDCLKGMKELPDESIDLMVTDPPYGLKFMGKDWDKAVPSVDVWKECFRVLKPGSFAFVMCIPRQDCLSRMIVNLQDAGFETAFTSIYWTYATGFPKAMDMAKAVQKKALGVPQGGKNPLSPNTGKFKSGCSEDNIEGRGFGAGAGHYMKEKGEKYELKLEDEQAKTLDGSFAGFQPKPAVEVILVAMKPLSENTFVEQALENQKGVTWLNDCRIPAVGGKIEGGCKGTTAIHGGGITDRNPVDQTTGRFPANLLVCDDMLNDGRVSKSTGGKGNATKESDTQLYSGYANRENSSLGGLGDVGSFSRYFDLDVWFDSKFEKLPEEVQKVFPFLIVPKASKSEKNKGCEKLEPRVEKTQGKGRDSNIRRCPEHNEPIPSGISTYKCGCKIQQQKQDFDKPKKNFHPTVKPIKLKTYLITLGSRPGDIVLDPYIGSGTTAIACRMSGRKHIGYEENPEYCQIANARLKPIPIGLGEFA